jgi:hypothetical protein
MDIDALHSALLSFTLLFGKLRLAREKLPATERTRSDFGQFLNEFERDLRIATATLAGELGFALCRCCWPPEVLATDLEGHVRCLGLVEKKSGSNMSASARRFSPGERPSAKPGVSKKRLNGSSPTAVAVPPGSERSQIEKEHQAARPSQAVTALAHGSRITAVTGSVGKFCMDGSRFGADH